MAKTTNLGEIDALAELERAGIEFEPAGDNEVRLRCPQHDDKSPSASLNVEKNLWKCHACGGGGDIVSMLSLKNGVTRAVMLEELGTRYDLKDVKVIQPDTVERYHAKVWDSGPLLKALQARGVSNEMIRLARLGFHDGRITIPVYDRRGRIRNIRRYMPGGPADRKMFNTKGYSTPRLYREADIDEHSKVWICGGEIKALVVGELLKNSGIGAVSATAGEGAWDHKWSKQFEGKEVFVCMDIDATGLAAALTIADALCSLCIVRIVRLPLDKERYPKGDVNDYIGKENANRSDLLHLMEIAETHERRALVQGPTERGLRDVELQGAAIADNIGWRLRFPAVVSTIDTTPYLVPRDVDTRCKRDQALCFMCSVAQDEPDIHGLTRKTIPATSPYILAMVGSTKKHQHEAIQGGLGIPSCSAVTFAVVTTSTVWDAQLTPPLEIDSQAGDNLFQPAMLVWDRPVLNEPYIAEAHLHPHPLNQQATLVVDNMIEAEDSLDSFSPTPDDLEALKLFQPESWSDEALEQRLDALYSDISGNVTHVYARQDLHLGVDLAYHSPLFMQLNGRRINGWAQVLILGDSAQGKSEVRERLSEHYGLGERFDCKNASVAGLLGGLQQVGSRWFHTWGVIPTHDRRLVWLEEVKGASPEVLGKLTDMRSSGVAEITKIEKARTHARTRMIFISNQRGSRQLKAYGYGVTAVLELMGALEDVRRLDLVIMLAAGDVDVRASTPTPEELPEHQATRELCRKLILWGWTLPWKNISWEPGAEEECQDVAERLRTSYTEAVPLIDSGSTVHKVARLAAALAVRTFSCEDGKLVVRGCHVRSIERLLRRQYDSPVFGYDHYSLVMRAEDKLKQPSHLRQYLGTCKHADTLISGMLYREKITLADLLDLSGSDRETGQDILSQLVRSNALVRERRHYRKTPPFIDLLKVMEKDPSCKGLAAESDEM